MKKNEGTVDRAVRLLAAVGLAVLYFTGAVGGTIGTVLLVVAAVLLLTSAFGICPAYLPFSISTCKGADA